MSDEDTATLRDSFLARIGDLEHRLQTAERELEEANEEIRTLTINEIQREREREEARAERDETGAHLVETTTMYWDLKAQLDQARALLRAALRGELDSGTVHAFLSTQEDTSEPTCENCGVSLTAFVHSPETIGRCVLSEPTSQKGNEVEP